MKGATRSFCFCATVVYLLLCWAPLGFGGNVTFQLNSGSLHTYLDGEYVNPYTATTTTGAQLNVICDDLKDNTYIATKYTFTQNTFSSLPGSGIWNHVSNFSDTTGMLYQMAGYLAVKLYYYEPFGSTPQGYVSYALWAVFDPADVASHLLANHGGAGCLAVFGNSSCTYSGALGGYLGEAQSNYAAYASIYDNFVVYTPVCGPKGPGSCQAQEFFGVPMPEGGSAALYLVLAGMSCLGAMLYSRRHIERGGLA